MFDYSNPITPDCFEEVSNHGLYLLRSAFGVKVHRSSETELPQITQLTNSLACRIFAGLFALTVLLPLTLIGIALERLSKTHSESYRLVREIKLKPNPTPTPPQSPPPPSSTTTTEPKEIKASETSPPPSKAASDIAVVSSPPPQQEPPKDPPPPAPTSPDRNEAPTQETVVTATPPPPSNELPQTPSEIATTPAAATAPIEPPPPPLADAVSPQQSAVLADSPVVTSPEKPSAPPATAVAVSEPTTLPHSTALVVPESTPPLHSTAVAVAATASELLPSAPTSNDKPSLFLLVPSKTKSPPKKKPMPTSSDAVVPHQKRDPLDELLLSGDVQRVKAFINRTKEKKQKDKVCSQLVQRANSLLHSDEGDTKKISDAAKMAFYQMTAATFCEHMFWIVNRSAIRKPKNFDLTVKVHQGISNEAQIIAAAILGTLEIVDPELLTSPLYINETVTKALGKNLNVSHVQVPLPADGKVDSYAVALPSGATLHSALTMKNGEVLGQFQPAQLAPISHSVTQLEVLTNTPVASNLDTEPEVQTKAPIASKTGTQLDVHTKAPIAQLDPAHISSAITMLATKDIPAIMAYLQRGLIDEEVESNCEELAYAALMWGMRPQGLWMDGRALNNEEVTTLLRSTEAVFLNMSADHFLSYIEILFDTKCPLVDPRLIKMIFVMTVNALNNTEKANYCRLIREVTNNHKFSISLIQLLKKADPQRKIQHLNLVWEALERMGFSASIPLQPDAVGFSDMIVDGDHEIRYSVEKDKEKDN